MYQLKVLSGSKAGQVLTLAPGQPLMIGRGAEAQLSVPDDPTLSRNHADLVIEGNQIILRNRSQHGSLVGGQVVQGNAPVQPGQEFQVGGTRLVLEPMAGAARGAAAPASGGMARPGGPPPTPQPVGGPVGPAPTPAGAGAPAGGGGAGSDAGAAAGAAGAAALAAAKNLPTGPAKITHSGPGIPAVDVWKGAIGIAMGNKMATLAMAAPLGLVVLFSGLGFGLGFAGAPGILLMILNLLSLPFMLLFAFGGPLLAGNYMAGVKEYQTSGKPIAITDLIKFTDIVPRYITFIIVGVSGICFILPLLFCWAIPLIVANPQIGFAGALKTSLKFTLKNIVPVIIYFIVGGILLTLMNIACLSGLFFGQSIACAAMMLVYLVKQDEFKAAAAEAGVQL